MGNNKARNTVTTCIILLALSLFLISKSTPLRNEGAETRFLIDEDKGNKMMMMSDLMRYGGYGIGIIGLSILIIALTKKNTDTSNNFPNQVIGSTGFSYCTKCSCQVSSDAIYCTQCGNRLAN